MSDTISRQAALDAIDKGLWGKDWDKALAVAIITDLPSAQPEQRWIPCSERLPSYGEDVLVSISGFCNVGHIVPVNDEK